MNGDPLGKFPGEAAAGAWDFVADHGPLPNPVGHTFPLLTHDRDGTWELIGTGFYVGPDGIFATAAHVVGHVLEDEQQVRPLAILQLGTELNVFGGQGTTMRPIEQCWMSETADVALGIAATMTHRVTGERFRNLHWPLSWSAPSVGTHVATHAYPNHRFDASKAPQELTFRPAEYDGVVLEVGEYRDALLVPYPYFHVSAWIHGASSGGPVFTADGRGVVGINVRGLDPADGVQPYGVVAQSRCFADAFFDDVVLLGEHHPRRVGFADLIKADAIKVAGFPTHHPPQLTGRVVRLDTVLPQAPRPQIVLTLSM